MRARVSGSRFRRRLLFLSSTKTSHFGPMPRTACHVSQENMGDLQKRRSLRLAAGTAVRGWHGRAASGTVERMDARYEPTWTYLRRVPDAGRPWRPRRTATVSQTPERLHLAKVSGECDEVTNADWSRKRSPPSCSPNNPTPETSSHWRPPIPPPHAQRPLWRPALRAAPSA